jgi:hypothetical protein
MTSLQPGNMKVCKNSIHSAGIGSLFADVKKPSLFAQDLQAFDIYHTELSRLEQLQSIRSGLLCFEGVVMKKNKEKAVEQPVPFSPGITRAQVRQHAFELYRDKLPNHPLTVEDWVLAEKDLVNSLEADNLPK